MAVSDNDIKVEILKWMGNNKWLNQDPSANDFSIEYFYNFFEKKFDNLTRFHLDELLCSLEAAGLVELKLYWNTRESRNRVDVIRGLTPAGVRWVNGTL